MLSAIARSTGSLAVSRHVLVSRLSVSEVSASPPEVSGERATRPFGESRGVCEGLLALTCLPPSSAQSGDSTRIYSEEVGHDRDRGSPCALVMPYREQRETKASTVNKVK